MAKAQYGILRFAKYKGPEISNIEAHNERTKETYASNPDVDLSRSKFNLHLIEPQDKYRAQAEAGQAAESAASYKRLLESAKLKAEVEASEAAKKDEAGKKDRAFFELTRARRWRALGA